MPAYRPREPPPGHDTVERGRIEGTTTEPGASIVDELTDRVEEPVLQEFEKIAERGGVLGAMETGYQRGKLRPFKQVLASPFERSFALLTRAPPILRSSGCRGWSPPEVR